MPMISRRTVLAAAVGCLILIVFLSIPVLLVQSRIQEMFRLNRQLQAERYHMTEFEYRMLGIAYLLDKGRYVEAFTLLDRYHRQLKTREGLVRLPKFASDEEELDFYLTLQNPRTGAFMDDAYPPCVYHGPTENVIAHIERLALKTGRPVVLRHPLHYLDRINTPETLTAFLDDVSTVGFIASRFPQTSFHLGRDILPLARTATGTPDQPDERLIERLGLYSFSPEWKRTMLRWFYEAQDPETGLWGPKSAAGELLKRDLQNTASILKAFKTPDGGDLYPEFPARYTDRLLDSALSILSEPPPPADDLPWVHEWNLKSLKGLKLITRYLWKDLLPDGKNRAAALFRKLVTINCERYYVAGEGGFSYYPDSRHASVDGSGMFLVFGQLGAFSAARQQKLWGGFSQTVEYDVSIDHRDLTASLLAAVADRHGANSFRLYQGRAEPEALFDNVRLVCYPSPTPVPDIMEMTRNMQRFLAATDLSMGNWMSMEDVAEQIKDVPVPDGLLFVKGLPPQALEALLDAPGGLTVVGFDRLQIPRVRLAVK